ERRDREPVPRRQHLVVGAGRSAGDVPAPATLPAAAVAGAGRRAGALLDLLRLLAHALDRSGLLRALALLAGGRGHRGGLARADLRRARRGRGAGSRLGLLQLGARGRDLEEAGREGQLLLVALQVRHAFLHPLRLRLAAQVVVEVLGHAPRPVLLVRASAQAVVLAGVVEQVALLAEPAQGGEVLDALGPRHGAVLVVVQDEHRRAHPVGEPDRRVLQVAQRVLPRRAADPALGLLVLE